MSIIDGAVDLTKNFDRPVDAVFAAWSREEAQRAWSDPGEGWELSFRRNGRLPLRASWRSAIYQREPLPRNRTREVDRLFDLAQQRWPAHLCRHGRRHVRGNG